MKVRVRSSGVRSSGVRSLHRHLAGHQALVYAIVRRKEAFNALQNLPLPVQKQQQQQQQQQLAEEGKLEESEDAPPQPKAGRFVPTAEWAQEWKARLPLNTVLRLLQFLVPQVMPILYREALPH
jgi:hypothetical protein